MSYTKCELTSMIVTSMMTGCTSLAASLTFIIMILRSNLKLSTMYRRLVFAINIFSLLLSLSQALSSLPMPAGTAVGAIGNDTTCNIQGLMTTVGLCGIILYSVSISIHFFVVIKCNLPQDTIKTRIEPILLAFPILYSCAVGTYLYTARNFSPQESICWINFKTTTACSTVGPDVDDCKRNARIDFFELIAIHGLLIFAFLINCIIMIAVWRVVNNQSERIQMSCREPNFSLSFIDVPSTDENNENEIEQENNENKIEQENPSTVSKIKDALRNSEIYKKQMKRLSKQGSTTTLGPLAARLSRPSRATTQFLREISNRLVAYIIGFIMAYGFHLTHQSWHLYYNEDVEVPFIISLFGRVFFTLQGVFNIIVYSYPYAASYRFHNKCSWVSAFWGVVKVGGDNDQVWTRLSLYRRRPEIRRRRHSIRNEPYVLDVDDDCIESEIKRIQASYQDHSTAEQVGNDLNIKDVENDGTAG